MNIKIKNVSVLSFVLYSMLGCKTSNFTGNARKAAELPPLESKNFQQLTYETRTVSVKQGTTGASSNESYAVTAKGVLDLLIVVDNSGSMAEEQNNLANRLTPLLSAVKDSDWQIAITTTDPADRCVTSLIQKGDWFIESRFKSAINAGIDGTGIERPFLRAVQGLESKCLLGPGKWVRSKSTLAVLIITDEDNCHVGSNGIGYGCVGETDLNYSYLTNYLASIRKIGTEARVYGIYWQQGTQCSTALKSSDEVSKAVAATSGTWGSICDADYSATLTKISSDVAQILNADFTLKSIPDAGSLKINVNGQNWTDFTLTGTVVHFTKNPPVNAAISVSYVSGAAGLVTDRFDLPGNPAAGSLSAKVGSQPAGPVTWDTASKKAIFASRPADGSLVEITFKEQVPLKDTFEIASGANPQYLKVVVNGVVVASKDYSYNATTGIVKFSNPPAESSKIEISWRGSKKSG
jgi:hypothetical protein